MWGNALAIKWGAAKKAVTLKDGKGQGNNIAVFPTFRQGICAQLDLWRSSPNYKNKRFRDAIDIWDGHNNTPSYIAYVKARVPGITPDTVMDAAFWRGPMAIPFLKAQAGHEAGRTYPAPEEDWEAARKRVLSGVPTMDTVKKAGTSVATTAPTTVALHQSGFPIWAAVAIAVGVAVVGFLIWKYKQRSSENPAIHDVPHPELRAPLPENTGAIA